MTITNTVPNVFENGAGNTMFAEEVIENFDVFIDDVNSNATSLNDPIIGALPFRNLITGEVTDANKIMANFEFIRSQVNARAVPLSTPIISAFPNDIKNNTTNDADDVNENFQHLVDEVNANVSDLPVTTIFYYDNGADQIGAFTWFGTFWTVTGGILTTPFDAGDPAITNLTRDNIAIVGKDTATTNRLLQNYYWSGLTFSPVGSGLVFGGSGSDNRAAALDSVSIAFTQGSGTAGNVDLGKYRFNGSIWSLVGNVFDTGNIAIGAGVCRLSEDTVAYFSGTAQELRVYQFDGTDWAQVGSAQSFTAASEMEMATIGPNKIAVMGKSEREIFVYSWNGSSFSQVGSTTILPAGQWAFASFQTDTLAIYNTSGNQLRTYTFNGTSWSQLGSSLSFSLAGDVELSSAFKP